MNVSVSIIKLVSPVIYCGSIPIVRSIDGWAKQENFVEGSQRSESYCTIRFNMLYFRWLWEMSRINRIAPTMLTKNNSRFLQLSRMNKKKGKTFPG